MTAQLFFHNERIRVQSLMRSSYVVDIKQIKNKHVIVLNHNETFYLVS